MYGTQAKGDSEMTKQQFENDVKMYGTQAIRQWSNMTVQFENDVKMYGTQAPSRHPCRDQRLRMM